MTCTQRTCKFQLVGNFLIEIIKNPRRLYNLLSFFLFGSYQLDHFDLLIKSLPFFIENQNNYLILPNLTICKIANIIIHKSRFLKINVVEIIKKHPLIHKYVYIYLYLGMRAIIKL